MRRGHPHLRSFAIIGIGLAQSIPAFSAQGLWHAVSQAPVDAAAREKRLARIEAGSVAGTSGAPRVGRGVQAPAGGEPHLRRALELVPDDFEAQRMLAEVLAASGRTTDATRAFDAARRLAPTSADEARMWFRLANERSRLGVYDQALDAYDRQFALGDVDPAALGNSAELLMAMGRLPEAIDRYREALAIEERAGDQRGRLQGRALGYFGLGVALDRQGRDNAAREAIGRALALDPGAAVLRLAQQENGDLFLVPPGDVFYYLALARLIQGRSGDAVAAFGDYLRIPAARYAARARAHVARLAASSVGTEGKAAPATSRGEGDTGASGGGVNLRVARQATLSADGPLVAPMIDAAWRLAGGFLDACLSDVVLPGDRDAAAPTRSSREFRVSLDVTLDESGRVGAVKMLPPHEIGDVVASCIEDAVKTRFQVTRPARRKPTRARMELVLAPAGPSG